MIKLNANIFRAYDIRGIYPEEMDESTANAIGKAFGTYLIRKTGQASPHVVLGRDNRLHSDGLHGAFTEGVLSTGARITDIGLCPTPYLYFATTYGEFDGGCNITASHNPKEYNGFKLVTAGGHAIFGDEIQAIYKLIEASDFIESQEGERISDDFYYDYLGKIQKIFTFKRSLKIVVDTGNGVAGNLYPKILKALGHDVVELYTELDGSFPNHEADPVKESNLEDLKKKVLTEKADLGLGFDGDGDRVGLVDETGAYHSADNLLMLMAQDVLTRFPGGSIVATVSNSQLLFDLIKKWGGNPIMCPVGHSYVESAMHEHQAVLGGEQSGHFFLPEAYYGYDDALVAACRLLLIASQSQKPVSGLFDSFPKTYAVPEIRPYCSDADKFKVMEKIKTVYSAKYPSTLLDGIRMDMGDGAWVGIRASNTSPRLSIIIEATSPHRRDELHQKFITELKTYPEIDFERS